MRPCLVVVALLLTATAGCGTDEPSPAPSPSPSPSPSESRSPSPSADVTGAPTVARTTTAARKGGPGTEWEITVYYTAVEDFHDGADTEVTGCTRLECKDGQDDLGSYPADFVEAVRDEGTGRTSSGQYLNWSYDVGFWLDSAPRTSDGQRLTPFFSAAADPDVLPQGTRFRITGCGVQDDGSAPQEAVCAALRDGAWTVTDEFTPGLGGSHHLDAYIGPETGENFTDSDWYVTLTGARLTIG